MANNTTLSYRQFQNSARERLEKAGHVLNKSASFEATDPNCKGTVTTPDCGDGSNREKLNLPKNQANTNDADKLHNLLNVTKPNGTGQGEYTTPRNGTAHDQAVQSFTAPVDKLAGAKSALAQALESVKQAASTSAPAAQPEAAQAPAPEAAATKEAAPAAAPADPAVTASDMQSSEILAKLAALGAVAISHEEGRRVVQAALEKEAGIKEAQNIISDTTDMITKYANAQQVAEAEQMQKIAAASATHQAWLSQFETDFEKQAYAQGAADGEQAAQALEAGQDPSAGDVGDITEEDVLQVLQELVQSGQLDENDLQALLGGVQQAGADGELTPDEIAQVLDQAVQSGELSPEQATAIAQQVLGAQGDAAEAAAAPAPEAEKAASYNTQNAINILNSIIPQ